MHDLQHRPAFVAVGQLHWVAGVMAATHARRFLEHIDVGRQVPRRRIGGRRGEKAIRGVAGVARRGNAVCCKHGIAIIAVRYHADGDAGAVERISRPCQIAVLNEISLRGDRAGAGARHGGAHRMHFGAGNRGVELRHGQPAAHVVRIHGRTLQSQVDERRFQLLRVCARDGIDEDQRRLVGDALIELHPRCQRPQILKRMIGPCQRRMARQVRERRIVLGPGSALALLHAAAAESMQARGPWAYARPQMRMSQR